MSFEVCSKQPRSWVVSVLSFNRMRTKVFLESFARVCKFFVNLAALFVRIKIGRLAYKQSERLYKAGECDPFKSKKSLKINFISSC